MNCYFDAACRNKTDVVLVKFDAGLASVPVEM